MIRYTTHPGTPRTSWLPVIRFEVYEDGFTEPWVYEVRATTSGLDWKPGHTPVRLAISQEQEAEAWREAMEVNDKQPF